MNAREISRQVGVESLLITERSNMRTRRGEMMSVRWCYAIPGRLNENHAIQLPFPINEREARRQVCELWGLRRLPKGFAIWRV